MNNVLGVWGLAPIIQGFPWSFGVFFSFPKVKKTMREFLQLRAGGFGGKIRPSEQFSPQNPKPKEGAKGSAPAG